MLRELGENSEVTRIVTLKFFFKNLIRKSPFGNQLMVIKAWIDTKTPGQKFDEKHIFT